MASAVAAVPGFAFIATRGPPVASQREGTVPADNALRGAWQQQQQCACRGGRHLHRHSDPLMLPQRALQSETSAQPPTGTL